jgi:hypothetical protein
MMPAPDEDPELPRYERGRWDWLADAILLAILLAFAAAFWVGLIAEVI